MRTAATLRTDVRRSGANRIPGVVTEISVTGCRVKAEERLACGSTVWLRIDPLAPLMAQVMWSQAYVAGCSFSNPLHPAVLDHLVDPAK